MGTILVSVLILASVVDRLAAVLSNNDPDSRFSGALHALSVVGLLFFFKMNVL
jgi:hypothetical protein